jgi:excisionase family DNA binding protein
MAEYLSTSEVARYLKLNQKKVYALVASGQLPAARISGKWLFPKELIDRWIAEHTVYPTGGLMGALLDQLLVLQGSDDWLLSRVIDRFQSRFGASIPVASVGSVAGVSAVAAGSAHVASSHVDPSLVRTEAKGPSTCSDSTVVSRASCSTRGAGPASRTRGPLPHRPPLREPAARLRHVPARRAPPLGRGSNPAGPPSDRSTRTWRSRSTYAAATPTRGRNPHRRADGRARLRPLARGVLSRDPGELHGAPARDPVPGVRRRGADHGGAPQAPGYSFETLGRVQPLVPEPDAPQ